MNPRSFDPGPLADVAHEVDAGRSTLVFVRRFGHSPARVWEILTDADQLAQWAPFEPDRDLGTPGPANLRMTDGNSTESFPAEVRRAVAPTTLEYTWGDDLLRWDLAPDTNGTRVTLRQTVKSPEWVPRVAAGWHLCTLVADHLLDGNPIGRIVGRDAKKYGWDALNEAYAGKLGIEAKGWPDEAFPDDTGTERDMERRL